MNPQQARALLALIADLYQLATQPDPGPDSQPDPTTNGQEPATVKVS